LALTANRIKVFAKRGKQPVLKWKQEIKDCEQNELIMSMEQSALNELYENEEGLLQYFVAGAIGVLTENICVARGLDIMTKLFMTEFGTTSRGPFNDMKQKSYCLRLLTI
jgi:hypothetical protein